MSYIPVMQNLSPKIIVVFIIDTIFIIGIFGRIG